jgi:hypothetical protein
MITKSLLFFSAFAAICMSTPLQAQPSGNLLLNGGFEEGLEGWRQDCWQATARCRGDWVFGLAHEMGHDFDIFCELKDKIGWGPFKKTFRAFKEMPQGQVPGSPRGKLQLFAHLLQTHSGVDVPGWLAVRGIPAK